MAQALAWGLRWLAGEGEASAATPAAVLDPT
jgi:hypothetical protein